MHTPVTDAVAREWANRTGLRLPELTGAVESTELLWEWYEGQYSGYLPEGWEEWSVDVEEAPIVFEWHDDWDDGGFAESASGCSAFTVVWRRYPGGDADVEVLPVMSEDTFVEWTWALGWRGEQAAVLDDYYAPVLRGFEPSSGPPTGEEQGELIAEFLPWEEARHRFRSRFELWERPDGSYTIVTEEPPFARSFERLKEAAQKFTEIATAFGVIPEARSASWPGAT